MWIVFNPAFFDVIRAPPFDARARGRRAFAPLRCRSRHRAWHARGSVPNPESV